MVRWVALALLLVGCGRAGLPIGAAPADAGAMDLSRADRPLEPGVACGAVSCASCVGQYCDSADDGLTGVCRPPTESATHLPFGCDGPEDCPSGACCLTDQGSACSALGFCTAGSLHGLWMCHTDPECGAGFVCCDVRAGSPYRACQTSC